MALIYVDSVICIYLIEGDGPRREHALEKLAQTDASLCVSPLVLMECLVKPFREDDPDLERRYRELLGGFETAEMGLGVWEAAARIRATLRLGAADAIHLAAARGAGCSELWTADAALAKKAPGFAVDLFADLT
ncbi:MAG: PIN domain-containing protein [Bifidobacteriaceae bacterium]|jgi:predicted nucleic acid-binding protein|nr:PIN domain-containing protein [Bifidobacteriaceae bacterium]